MTVESETGRAGASVPTLTIAPVIPGPAQQAPGISQPSPLDSGFAPSGAPRNDGGAKRWEHDTGHGDAGLRDVLSDVEAYYSARVAKHGATPLGVDWSCWATQNLRFVQILKLCDFTAPFALNDIGCGYGALAAYLAMRHDPAEIDYLGVDLSRAMVRRARRRFSGPARRFVVAASLPRVADYSVASGVMNVSLGHSREVWEDFVATILRDMRRASRRGFSVNFIDADRSTAHAENDLADGLYRTTPQRWIAFCESELGCSVETIDGYGMREFTLLMRCNEPAAT